MSLFVFLVLTVSTSLQAQAGWLDIFKAKSDKAERHLSQFESEPDPVQDNHDNPSWKNISPIKNSKISLYQWTGNPHLLISIKKDKGLSIKKISDLNVFFEKREKEKLVILSKTSIQNRQVTQSQIEHSGHIALFYTKGTYLDFQKKTVLFEDVSLYHNKLSLHILIHNTQAFTPAEVEAVYSFLDNRIKSTDDLSAKEKKEFLFLTKKIKNASS